MRHIRSTNTNKGRGQQRGICNACGRKGLGPSKIWNAATPKPFVARKCRYCAGFDIFTMVPS